MNGSYHHISNEVSRKVLIQQLQDQPLGFQVKIEKAKKSNRTLSQNAALHKFCELLADELNNAGLDMRAVMKPEVDMPWTMTAVKEHLWRPIQKAMTSKASTADADTSEYSEIYRVLMRHLSEKFNGVYVPWPSKN